MNRLSASLLLTALLSSVLSPTRAAAPAGNAAGNTSWYDVELVVFRYTDPQAGNLESWPADPGIPDWNAASALLPLPATGTTPVLTPLMQINAHQLDDVWNRLKNSHDYEPLLHVAWVEPLADHGNAVSVRIGVPPPPPAATSIPGLIVTPLPASTPAATGTPLPAPTPAYGSVKFSQYGPYLHLDVDLVCQGPIAEHIMQVPTAATSMNSTPAVVNMAAPATATLPNTTPDLQWYRMTEDRRIEAGKLNYFDNPLFGLLVLVTPHPVSTPATAH